MTPDDVLHALVTAGALEPDETWTLEAAAGGLNSRVFRVLDGSGVARYTARMRQSGSFAHEIEALAEVAGCPGVPAVVFGGERILLHRYLAGAPRPLAEIGAPGIASLAGTLVCLHRHASPGFTPWPEREPLGGTLADLFHFRVRTLATYTSYPRAAGGEIDPRLPRLLEVLDAPETLSDTSWAERSFARLHGDLSYGNILWSDTGAALIDWEFSRVGDPAEDLAYLLTEQAADAALSEGVRDAYMRAGGESRVWKRVPAYAVYTVVDSALWWTDYALTRAVDPGPEIERRVAGAMRWLADLPRG